MKTNKSIHLGGRLSAYPKELLALKADVNYTKLLYKNGDLKIVATTLKSLEKRLSDCGFYRTHKNAMVNFQYVRKVTKHRGKVFVELINKESFEVSRRRQYGMPSYLS